MQEILSSNPPVVTGIYDPNKSWARHHHSLKLGSKLKYLNDRALFFSKLMMIFQTIFLQYLTFRDLIMPWSIGCVFDVVFEDGKNNLTDFKFSKWGWEKCGYLLYTSAVLLQTFDLIITPTLETRPHTSSSFVNFASTM